MKMGRPYRIIILLEKEKTSFLVANIFMMIWAMKLQRRVQQWETGRCPLHFMEF